MKNKTIQALLEGREENHQLPFLWLHGEDEATLRQMMAVIHGANCGAVCLVPYVLRRARVIELPAMLTFVIALASALHGIGLVTDAYTTLSYYDTITHTLSSTVIGLLVFYALICVQHYAGGRVNFTGRGLALFTALITLTNNALSLYSSILLKASIQSFV